MASRLDPLRWTSARTLHASPFEGVPGLHRLVHVQAMFDRHAAGKGAARAMNQRAGALRQGWAPAGGRRSMALS